MSETNTSIPTTPTRDTENTVVPAEVWSLPTDDLIKGLADRLGISVDDLAPDELELDESVAKFNELDSLEDNKLEFSPKQALATANTVLKQVREKVEEGKNIDKDLAIKTALAVEMLKKLENQMISNADGVNADAKLELTLKNIHNKYLENVADDQVANEVLQKANKTLQKVKQVGMALGIGGLDEQKAGEFTEEVAKARQKVREDATNTDLGESDSTRTPTTVESADSTETDTAQSELDKLLLKQGADAQVVQEINEGYENIKKSVESEKKGFWSKVAEFVSGEKFESKKGKILYALIKIGIIAGIAVTSPVWAAIVAPAVVIASAGAGVYLQNKRFKEAKSNILEKVGDNNKEKWEKALTVSWLKYLTPVVIGLGTGVGVVATGGLVGVGIAVGGMLFNKWITKTKIEKPMVQELDALKNELKKSLGDVVGNTRADLKRALFPNADDRSPSVFFGFSKIRGQDGNEQEVIVMNSPAVRPAFKSLVSVLAKGPLPWDDTSTQIVRAGGNPSLTYAEVKQKLDSLLDRLGETNVQFILQQEDASILSLVIDKLYERAFSTIASEEERKQALATIDALHAIITGTQFINVVYETDKLASRSETASQAENVKQTFNSIDFESYQYRESAEVIVNEIIESLKEVYGLSEDQAKELLAEFTDAAGDDNGEPKLKTVKLYALMEHIVSNWENVPAEKMGDFVNLLYKTDGLVTMSNYALLAEINKPGLTAEQKADAKKKQQALSKMLLFSSLYTGHVWKANKALKTARVLPELDVEVKKAVSAITHKMDYIYGVAAGAGRLASVGIEHLWPSAFHQSSDVVSDTDHSNNGDDLVKSVTKTDDMHNVVDGHDTNSLANAQQLIKDSVIHSYHDSVSLQEYLQLHDSLPAGVDINDFTHGLETHLGIENVPHEFIVDNQGHLHLFVLQNNQVVDMDYGAVSGIFENVDSVMSGVESGINTSGVDVTHHFTSTDTIDLDHIQHSVAGHDVVVTHPYGDAGQIDSLVPGIPTEDVHYYMMQNANSLTDAQKHALEVAFASGRNNQDRALQVLSLKVTEALQGHGGQASFDDLAHQIWNSSASAQSGFEGNEDLFKQTLAQLLGANGHVESAVSSSISTSVSGMGAESVDLSTVFENLKPEHVQTWDISDWLNSHSIDSASGTITNGTVGDIASGFGEDAGLSVDTGLTPEAGSEVTRTLKYTNEFYATIDLGAIKEGAEKFFDSDTWKWIVGIAGASALSLGAWAIWRKNRNKNKETTGLKNVTKIEGLNLTDAEKKLLPEVMNILGKEFVWHKLPSGAELGVAKKWGEFAIGGRRIEAFVATIKQKQASNTSGTTTSDGTSGATDTAKKEKLTPVLIVRENGQVRVLPMKEEGLDDTNELLRYIRDGQGLELSGEYLHLYEYGQEINALLDTIANKNTRFDLTNPDIAGNFIPEVISYTLGDVQTKGFLGNFEAGRKKGQYKLNKETLRVYKELLTKIFLHADTKEAVESWKMEWDAEEALGKVYKVFGDKIDWDTDDLGKFKVISKDGEIVGGYKLFDEEHEKLLPVALQGLTKVATVGYGVAFPKGVEIPDGKTANMEGVGFYFVSTDKGLVILSTHPVHRTKPADGSTGFSFDQMRITANKHSPFREIPGLDESLLTEDSESKIIEQLQKLGVSDDKLDAWKLNLLSLDRLLGHSLTDIEHVKIRDERLIIFGEERKVVKPKKETVLLTLEEVKEIVAKYEMTCNNKSPMGCLRISSKYYALGILAKIGVLEVEEITESHVKKLKFKLQEGADVKSILRQTRREFGASKVVNKLVRAFTLEVVYQLIASEELVLFPDQLKRFVGENVDTDNVDEVLASLKEIDWRSIEQSKGFEMFKDHFRAYLQKRLESAGFDSEAVKECKDCKVKFYSKFIRLEIPNGKTSMTIGKDTYSIPLPKVDFFAETENVSLVIKGGKQEELSDQDVVNIQHIMGIANKWEQNIKALKKKDKVTIQLIKKGRKIIRTIAVPLLNGASSKTKRFSATS